ncbi:hypothetical protein BGY98DRAFT_979881, partial [Russula aff. rugulosa BPL654]
MLNHIHVCQLGVLILQAQTRDDNKAASHSYHIHTYSLHGTAWPPPIAISLCLYRLHLPLSLQQPSQR